MTGNNNMDDHQIDINHNEKSDVSDILSITPSTPRQSEPWNTKMTAYINNIKHACIEKGRQHELAGHHYRSLEVRWGIPTIVTPAVFGPLVLLINAANTGAECGVITIADYVSTTGFILSAFFTSIFGFFEHGRRSNKHHMYSSKYADVTTDIDAELVKKRTFRLDAGVFITTMKMKFDNLRFGEPTIPQHITALDKKENDDSNK